MAKCGGLKLSSGIPVESDSNENSKSPMFAIACERWIHFPLKTRRASGSTQILIRIGQQRSYEFLRRLKLAAGAE
jgi:hypothetical protein